MEQKDVLKALQRDHAAELKLAAKRLKETARHTEIIPSPVLSLDKSAQRSLLYQLALSLSASRLNPPDLP